MRNDDWKHGSDTFYQLLEQMGDIHNKKSHDYASNGSPFANYQFAGQLSKLFNNPDDSGFIGRLAEKIFRIANIENAGKTVQNESIEDTETDICVIVALWVAMRRERRKAIPQANPVCAFCTLDIDVNIHGLAVWKNRPYHPTCYDKLQQGEAPSRREALSAEEIRERVMQIVPQYTDKGNPRN